MNTKYQMWLNYDNDRKKFRFPVLPDEITVTIKSKTTSINIDQIGEIFHKGKRDAMTISFSSFFPAKYDQSCSVAEKDFLNAAKCGHWIRAVINAANPAHFVFTGSPASLNMDAIITNYVQTEQGGDPGTIYYTLELREYRTVAVRKIINPNAVKPFMIETPRKTSTGVKTYTVQYGDCLWNIAKKFYGNGSEYTKILNANKTALDADAKKHGYTSSNNGNILFAGLVLTIP